MGAEVTSVDGNVITVALSGKQTLADVARVQTEVSALIRKLGSVRLLIVAEQFAGWQKEGDWGNISFHCENDPFIDKIALVAERQWEGLALIFAGKGVRRPAIEFFPAVETEKARLWLTSGP